MVVGGIAIRTTRYKDIEADIQKIKSAAGIKSEMKWSKYRGGARRVAYQAMVDLFFALIENRHAAFHCLIANFGDFTHGFVPDGSPDQSVSRMYYQLLLHRPARYYGKACRIMVYPDKGQDSSQLQNFRRPLCFDAYQRYETAVGCVSAIQPQDSEMHGLLQMVDIIVGAISYQRNERHARERCAASKRMLAAYVLEKSKRPDWTTDTAATERFFTIWNFRHNASLSHA